jgi:hypothetical protein
VWQQFRSMFQFGDWQRKHFVLPPLTSDVLVNNGRHPRRHSLSYRFENRYQTFQTTAGL